MNNLINTEDLWKKVGFERLRENLGQTSRLTKRFELSLQDLPECNQCAKLKMLEQIQKSGQKLSAELSGITILIETLKETVLCAEQERDMLLENIPNPCSCDTGQCTCH